MKKKIFSSCLVLFSLLTFSTNSFGVENDISEVTQEEQTTFNSSNEIIDLSKLTENTTYLEGTSINATDFSTLIEDAMQQHYTDYRFVGASATTATILGSHDVTIQAVDGKGLEQKFKVSYRVAGQTLDEEKYTTFDMDTLTLSGTLPSGAQVSFLDDGGTCQEDYPLSLNGSFSFQFSYLPKRIQVTVTFEDGSSKEELFITNYNEAGELPLAFEYDTVTNTITGKTDASFIIQIYNPEGLLAENIRSNEDGLFYYTFENEQTSFRVRVINENGDYFEKIWSAQPEKSAEEMLLPATYNKKQNEEEATLPTEEESKDKGSLENKVLYVGGMSLFTFILTLSFSAMNKLDY